MSATSPNSRLHVCDKCGRIAIICNAFPGMPWEGDYCELHHRQISEELQETQRQEMEKS